MVKPRIIGLEKDGGDTMTNLLDSSSGSDAEWLTLPPLKGKKRKKKKVAKQSEMCSGIYFLKITLILALVASICFLGVVAAWMASQISELKEQMKKVEGKNGESQINIQRLTSQLSNVNHTLGGVTSGTNSIKQIFLNLSAIQDTIAQLSKQVDAVSKGLDTAPELKQLPTKLETVSKIVAELGSAVSTMKGDMTAIDNKVKTAEIKLQDLSKKTNETAPSDFVTPDFANMFQSIPVQIDKINASVSTRLSVIQSRLQQHETQFARLDNVTRELAASVATLTSDHGTITSQHATINSNHTTIDASQLHNIVHDMISNMTTNSTGSSVNLDTNTMTQLLGNMDNLTTAVAGLRDQYETLKDTRGEATLPLADLQALDVSVKRNITHLNESITALEWDLSHAMTQLSRQAVKLSNLTSQMTVNRYSIIRQQHILAAIQAPVETSTKATVTDSTTTTASILPGGMSTKQSGEATTPRVTVAPDGDQKPPDVAPAISIPGIQNKEDLLWYFNTWDDQDAGEVSYEALVGDLDTDAPDRLALQQFDSDSNELYTVDELAAALGITLDKNTDGKIG